MGKGGRCWAQISQSISARQHDRAISHAFSTIRLSASNERLAAEPYLTSLNFCIPEFRIINQALIHAHPWIANPEHALLACQLAPLNLFH